MQPQPKQSNLPQRIEPYLSKYKELIITTIICLFLTGIYDSINNQTAEIKKWYELMINIQAEQRIQSIDLESLKKSIETHQSSTTITLEEHEGRLRALEIEITPNNP
ncbi:hypothetical protein [Rhodohalobacter mucosus]|uniref:Uncharacterized protein n=1 Tax=Rhodohalobacter mucosus TaxID=2079485 RepID=A0A316TNX5_9BACT|nr:hypothetical protein [Rhodohalobacter mucosus]PWN06100.1 hypothetical protein DDZ15_09610 [Rhodohalobacter mucosus]